MDGLGRASKTPIVTHEHRLMVRLALDAGGAAKPSGAGGGDIAVAVFRDSDSLKDFCRKCLRHELIPLDISLGAAGLRREDT
jgi:phosphomevalonate kinase